MSQIRQDRQTTSSNIFRGVRKQHFEIVILISFILLLFLISINPAVAQGKKGRPSVSSSNILLNFKDAPLGSVLGYLSEVAGLIIVSESNLEERITVISRNPLTVDEAVGLLNSVLVEKDYAAIRMDRTLKIVPFADAKTMNIPVLAGNDPKALTPSDELVTYIIPVRYANVVTLQENLATLIPANAGFTANGDTNSLIITDTKANVRRVLEIISALDTHMASVAEIRVFHLEYSDAVATATLIEEMFQEQNQASSSSGRSSRNSANSIFSQMRSLAQSSSGKGGKSSRGGKRTNVQSSSQSSAGGNSVSVTATADERTNSLVVSAPPDTLDVIEELITDLDANPAEGQSIFIYPLKNARADNIKEVLNNLFEEFEGTSTQNIGASSNRRQNNQTSRGGTGAARSGGGGSGGGGKAPLGLGQGFGAGSRGGGRSSARTSTASSADSASINDLSGEVFIEADEDTNSLIIMTSARNYEKVKAILDELDKPVQQVLIKILFAEVTHDDTLELGTDFSYVGTLGRSGQAQILTDLGVTQSNGIIGNIIDNDFEATLRALETDGKLNILSRPYILASNNQTASITVGNEVPFIRDTRTTDTGQTINTIEYEDIGIILEVTPYINPEGLVIMDVNQEISAITGDSVTISQSEGSITTAPVFAKRASENRVIARNAQTVVIGGLMEDRQTEVHKKVPILGSIPILGWLFRSTQIQTVKTELLIFLTPHVVDRDEDLVAITEKEKTANKLVSEMMDQKLNSEDMETTPENNE